MADDGIAIWHGVDGNGTRSIWAKLEPDGRLVISGQDLGPGVRIWGPDFAEYEWWWVVEPDEVARVVEVLGGRPGDDAIELLARWTVEHGGQDPGVLLRDVGIRLAFDSRLGD